MRTAYRANACVSICWAARMHRHLILRSTDARPTWSCVDMSCTGAQLTRMGPGRWVHRCEAKHGACPAGVRPEQVQTLAMAAQARAPPSLAATFPPLACADSSGGRVGSDDVNPGACPRAAFERLLGRAS
eukprot:14085633-Alexandrium_andersonii.AAC.1